MKWPSGSGAGAHPAGRVYRGGRVRCAAVDWGRPIRGARPTRSPTQTARDGLARRASPFRMPRGIALYGHKTNGTARLVESRHKPATAAERIPNGITTTGGGRPETLPLRPATGRRLVAAGARVHSDALSRRARDAYPFPAPDRVHHERRAKIDLEIDLSTSRKADIDAKILI